MSSLDRPGLPADRHRVSRARLTYVFERYATGSELISVDEATRVLGAGRDRLALLILQGRLAVAEEVREMPGARPGRSLIRAEVEALRSAIAAESLEPDA